MKCFNLFGIVLTATMLSATQASWCQFYYDSACTNSANGETNFNCGDHDVFGSGGGFVKCHRTVGNGQTCEVRRCDENTCGRFQSVDVAPDQSCVGTGGAGPWYRIYLL